MADAPEPRRPPAWDTAGMTTLRSDVASAAGTAGGVALHFGRREEREGGAAGVSLLATLELTPYHAKRLQELLSVLVRQHDQRQGAADRSISDPLR